MYAFIVNHRAGNGKGLKVWRHIQRRLELERVEYRAEFPLCPEHAVLLVSRYVREHPVRAVVVVGGDGTVQSVVGAIGDCRVPLGIVPAGSGNDIARGLGLPLHPEEALDVIFNGTVQTVDLARIRDRCCVTVVGAGIDGEVAHAINHGRFKKWFNWFKKGHWSYAVSLIHVLLRYNPTRFTLRIDGDEKVFSRVWLVAVANFPNYAGGMRICPEACHTDGILHVCVVHGLSRWEVVRLFPKVYSGNHILHPAVTVLTGRKVEVLSDEPVVVHGDGEVMGRTPVEVTVQKEAVSVITGNAASS